MTLKIYIDRASAEKETNGVKIITKQTWPPVLFAQVIFRTRSFSVDNFDKFISSFSELIWIFKSMMTLKWSDLFAKNTKEKNTVRQNHRHYDRFLLIYQMRQKHRLKSLLTKNIKWIYFAFFLWKYVLGATKTSTCNSSSS